MKYFLLRPSFVDDNVRQTYRNIATTLEKGGGMVTNRLDEKWERHLKESYETDRHAYPEANTPSFETYCLIRNLMAISVHDCLVIHSRPFTHSEKAQYEFACAAHKLIKEIDLH